MLHIQSQLCGTKVKTNNRYSSKQNRVREKDLNKQTMKGLQEQKNVY